MSVIIIRDCCEETCEDSEGVSMCVGGKGDRWMGLGEW